ncbi:MAG TPA: bifunctional phosphoribosylaminoimidazolecarboxamide formyltransferase/IMP cyclohydrolase [Thermoplasmata archaeon]
MPDGRRAILSVSDKRGIVDFAKGLVSVGYELLGTDGTAKVLRAEKVPVESVSDYTGHPEVLGGRVKTLHPKVFAAILAVEGTEEDLERNDIEPIDLVAANLYPFEETVARPGVSHSEVIENIDIGGAALIRAAAKNAQRVTVVVRPSRYPEVFHALRAGGVPLTMREALAREAFEYTSGYDAAIYNYLTHRNGVLFPPALRLALPKIRDLRYGENPHQRAALYRETVPYASVGNAEQLGGREMSYNNILDLDTALRIATEFERPAAVVVKHTNPSGVALADRLVDAYRTAHAADPISAYGGIVGVNRIVDEATAQAMKPHVLDAVIASGYEPAALEILKQKKKGDFLIARTQGEFRRDHDLDMVRVLGGLLVQTTHYPDLQPEALKVVTTTAPTPEQVRAILFATKVSRYVKSNSIVLASGERTVGIGAGQMSRVDACMLACYKAREAARRSVAVSDAYFPFRDGIDELAKGGIAAIAQPGGSIRDSEVIAAADEHGMAMVFTGLRLFKH